MAVAASITDAITLAQFNLQLKNNLVGAVFAALVAYNANWPLLLNEQDQNNRTVLDWLVLLAEQASSVTATNFASQRQIEAAGDVLARQLTATLTAAAAGRISGAQQTAILAAYNTYLG